MEPAPGIIEKSLDQGEAVLWWGRPNPARAAAEGHSPRILMAALMMALGVFLAWPVFDAGFVWAGALAAAVIVFGAGLGTLGLLFAASPLIAFLGAGATLYAVTGKRVLIITGGRRLRAYGPLGLGPVAARPSGASGLGSVVFAQERDPWMPGKRHQLMRDVAFHGIAGADAVAALIRSGPLAAAGAQKQP